MDISKLFISAEETKEPETVFVTGNIPSWLEGSFIQIGPGKVDLSPNYSLNDWLDGYGIIIKFDISQSKSEDDISAGVSVTLSTRFVESESFRKAEETGKPQFTEYGTVAQGKSLLSKIMSTFTREDLSDNCSASLYLLGKELCASAATSYFHLIDPVTLATGQRYDAKTLCGQHSFGVHPLEDDEGNWWNMGFSVFPTFRYNVLKLPPPENCNGSGGIPSLFSRAKVVSSIPSRWNGAFALNHSFGMTSSFLVFVEQPLVVKISRVLSANVKGLPVKDWLEWRSGEKNRFYIVDKGSGKVLCPHLEILSGDSFFFLHFVNCFEVKKDGPEGLQREIIMDIATSTDPSVIHATSLSKLRSGFSIPSNIECSRIQRFTISLEGLNNHRKTKIILSPVDLTPKGVDRLGINKDFIGREYNYVYGAGSFLSIHGPFAHSVCKINVNLDNRKVERWFESESHYPGEPYFISKSMMTRNGSTDEDDGVVLCPVETVDQGGCNFLLFLDAKSWKEIGRATFKNTFCGALHGIFLPIKLPAGK